MWFVQRRSDVIRQPRYFASRTINSVNVVSVTGARGMKYPQALVAWNYPQALVAMNYPQALVAWNYPQALVEWNYPLFNFLLKCLFSINMTL
jgi:hypothetical protein